MLRQIIVASVILLSLMACSEDVLTPQYGEKTAQTMPDKKTMEKQPFMIVTGDWINNTNDIVIHIDSLGNFVMRDSSNAQITEEKGKLKNVSTSYAMNDLRFELYNEKNQPMHLAFGVRQVDEKTRNLVLLDGSTSTSFRPAQD